MSRPALVLLAVLLPLCAKGAPSVRPEIRVGFTDGDLSGRDQRVLQAAVDHIASLGGGTVRLGPGEWTLRNSIVLRSGVALVGAGEATVLRKAPGGTSLLAEDGDYGDVRLLPEDASSFAVGDGVTVRSNRFGGFFSTVATVIRKDDDGALILDERLNADLMVSDGVAVSHACPLIRATDQHEVAVRDLVIEGNREQRPPEDGCRGGGINLLRVASVTITTEPKMAFARPPVSAIGGGVISLNTDSASPPNPSRTVSNRIHASQNRPKPIASSDSVSAMTFMRLRLRWRAILPADSAALVEPATGATALTYGSPRCAGAATAAAWTAPARRR